MTEFRTGITLSLTNGVSGGLGAIIRDLAKTDAQAAKLRGTMKQIGVLAASGALVGGAGFMMLESLKAPIEEAKKWQTQLTKMRQMGLGDAQIKDAEKFVTATEIIGTSMNDRMRHFVEAQGAFRESGMSGLDALNAAKVMTPVLSNYQAAMATLSGGQHEAAESAMQQMNKTVEIMGGLNDPAKAQAIADGIFKAVQSSGKMVSERDLRQFMTQGGTAAVTLPMKAIFAELEPIIGEFGGSVTGTGMQTAFNRMNGILSKPPKLMVNEMMKLGLWDKSKLEFNSQGGIKSMKGDPLKAPFRDLMTSDPIAFAEKMIKTYNAHGITSLTDIARENEIVFGRTGGRIYTKIMQQLEVMKRSAQAFDHAEGASDVTKDKNNFAVAEMEFSKALKDLELVIGQEVLPLLTPALRELADDLHKMAAWARDNPKMFNALVDSFIALGAAMLISGVVLELAAAFKALNVVLGLLKIPGAAGGGGAVANVVGTASRGLRNAGWIGALGYGAYEFEKHMMDRFTKFDPKADAGSVFAGGVEAPPTSRGYGAYEFEKHMMDRFTKFDPKADAGSVFAGGVEAPPTSRGYGAYEFEKHMMDRFTKFDPKADAGSVFAGSVEAPPTSRGTTQVSTTINLDGRQIANVVSEHQVKQGSGPAPGVTYSDPTATPQLLQVY